MGIMAWHFLNDDRRLAYAQADGSRPIVTAGMELVEDRPLRLCRVGLHASERALDALCYARGSVACRVECSGEVLRGGDKLCSSRRRVAWMFGASPVLDRFAVDVARELQESTPNVMMKGGRRAEESVMALAAKEAWIRGATSEGHLIKALNRAIAVVNLMEEAVRMGRLRMTEDNMRSLDAARAAAYAADPCSRVAAFYAARSAATSQTRAVGGWTYKFDETWVEAMSRHMVVLSARLEQDLERAHAAEDGGEHAHYRLRAALEGR